MNTSEAIRARRSIRKYQPGVRIPREDVEKMLEAAMMAPSARNTRPWEFVVVEDRQVLDGLMAVHPYCGMLKTASLAVVVCGRPDLQEDGGNPFWPEDCGAAIENLLLQAVELGYGTCWCGCYPTQPRTDDVKKAIGCDSVPVGIVAVGVPDEEPATKGFYDADRVKFI